MPQLQPVPTTTQSGGLFTASQSSGGSLIAITSNTDPGVPLDQVAGATLSGYDGAVSPAIDLVTIQACNEGPVPGTINFIHIQVGGIAGVGSRVSKALQAQYGMMVALTILVQRGTPFTAWADTPNIINATLTKAPFPAFQVLP